MKIMKLTLAETSGDKIFASILFEALLSQVDTAYFLKAKYHL